MLEIPFWKLYLLQSCQSIIENSGKSSTANPLRCFLFTPQGRNHISQGFTLLVLLQQMNKLRLRLSEKGKRCLVQFWPMGTWERDSSCTSAQYSFYFQLSGGNTEAAKNCCILGAWGIKSLFQKKEAENINPLHFSMKTRNEVCDTIQWLLTMNDLPSENKGLWGEKFSISGSHFRSLGVNIFQGVFSP